MQTIDDVVPNYQPKDFVYENGNPNPSRFRGPIYKLTYHLFNEIPEMFFWVIKGYRISSSIGSINENGIKVELIKPRGDFIDL